MAGGGTVLVLGEGLLADIGWRLPFGSTSRRWVLVPLLLRLPAPSDGAASGDGTSAASPHGDDVPWRRVLPICALAILGMVAFYLVPTQLPFYVGQLTGRDAGSLGTVSGLVLALATGVAALASLNYGRVNRRLSHGNTMVV